MQEKEVILKNNKASQNTERLIVVGVAGFEPTTSSSQTRRDTGLRYTPNFCGEREIRTLGTVARTTV